MVVACICERVAMAQSSNQLPDRTALPTAQSCLTEEESRIQAEIDAFDQFLEQLQEIQVQASHAPGGSLITTIQSWFHASEPPQTAVESAYQETILAVEHWADAYGEDTTYESMANEFGADIVAGVTGGSATWSPQLLDQLCTASAEAIETRKQTCQVLREEQEQLEDLYGALAVIGEDLATVERGTDTFTDRSKRLTTVQNHLDQLAAEHQAYLQQRSTSNVEEELFSSLIYGDLDTDHPGLAALATARDVYDRIEHRHWAGTT